MSLLHDHIHPEYIYIYICILYVQEVVAHLYSNLQYYLSHYFSDIPYIYEYYNP